MSSAVASRYYSHLTWTLFFFLKMQRTQRVHTIRLSVELFTVQKLRLFYLLPVHMNFVLVQAFTLLSWAIWPPASFLWASPVLCSNTTPREKFSLAIGSTPPPFLLHCPSFTTWHSWTRKTEKSSCSPCISELFFSS